MKKIVIEEGSKGHSLLDELTKRRKEFEAMVAKRFPFLDKETKEWVDKQVKLMEETKQEPSIEFYRLGMYAMYAYLKGEKE